MLDTTALSFAQVRKEIIKYLSANDVFKSYNFDAPGISLLIDALSYTTQYINTYANFSINEAFLDSAQLRHNIVSHAKEIGYIPRQYTAARAKIRLRIDETKYSMSSKLKIPANSTFIGSTSDNNSFTFKTSEETLWKQDSGNFWYVDLEIKEGKYVTETFQQNDYGDARFFLSNNNVDTDFMEVYVYENQSDLVGEKYELATSLSDFSDSSRLYYLQEAYNGKVEIYFGDGVLSKAIEKNEIIKVKYLVTNGSDANNIINFSVDNTNDFYAYVKNDTTSTKRIAVSDLTVITVESSNSGAGREDIESIRFNAPKFLQSQDRAITTNDYNSLVVKKYGGWISSISSWGGENNDVIEFGTIFICIKPKYSDYLSDTQKEEIVSYLKTKNMPCVEPKIVNPEYIALLVSMDTEWNPYKTTKTVDEIIELIKNCVIDFFSVNNAKFNISYKYSQLLKEIVSLDNSIQGVNPIFKLQQTFEADKEYIRTYSFSFFNRIKKESVLIGPWLRTSNSKEYKVIDTYDGNLHYYEGGTDMGIVGSVDYANGKITLESFTFPSNYYVSTTTDENIPVTITLENSNINTEKNYIIELDEEYLNVTVQE